MAFAFQAKARNLRAASAVPIRLIRVLSAQRIRTSGDDERAAIRQACRTQAPAAGWQWDSCDRASPAVLDEHREAVRARMDHRRLLRMRTDEHTQRLVRGPLRTVSLAASVDARRLEEGCAGNHLRRSGARGTREDHRIRSSAWTVRAFGRYVGRVALCQVPRMRRKSAGARPDADVSRSVSGS